MSQDAIVFYNRAAREYETEKILGELFLRLAYKYPLRPATRLSLFRYAFFSRLMGLYADSKLSRLKIASTIERLGIDMSEVAATPGEFKTFNDFFIRRLKPECRPFDKAPEVICSPADCRISICQKVDGNTVFKLKGSQFDLWRLLGDPGELYADMFSGGTAAVCRLSPADCHRFAFPIDCRVLKNWFIDGRLDSVSPIALQLGLPVFQENSRRITILDGGRFGLLGYVEVGAFGVGRIVQTYSGIQVGKMQEKGYFAFGGSSIVLLFQRGKVLIDDDLQAQSLKGYETYIRMGERIGTGSAMGN